ncbi:hypothetical protein IPM62_02280 [Candidatus Woesebacteria bacterium]|nr:MAG: hypothetical protein IPM62_02280 [Candidatus Woesebacteria bacterium]
MKKNNTPPTPKCAGVSRNTIKNFSNTSLRLRFSRRLNKVIFIGSLGLFIYLATGILLEVFVIRTAYYCPFKYGGTTNCGHFGSEYFISWLFDKFWWPIELLIFVMFSQPGIELPLW